MTKEIIDEFLCNKEDIKNRIKDISKKYTINDFALFSDKTRDYFKNDVKEELYGVYGCLYNLREKILKFDLESYEQRLLNEYMELLIQLLESDEMTDVVYYIIAYHYLSLCEDIAYTLTIDDKSPFPFMEKEISPLAKERLREYKEISHGQLRKLFNHLDEEDLIYFNRIFLELRKHHHATKHFSLINSIINIRIEVGKYDFDYSFVELLNLFIFSYRVIFTEKELFIYMNSETKEKIINGLVEY